LRIAITFAQISSGIACGTDCGARERSSNQRASPASRRRFKTYNDWQLMPKRRHSSETAKCTRLVSLHQRDTVFHSTALPERHRPNLHADS
jgi:hypothetical protein